MGQHSLTNLYPVLHYLGVSLKYICVTSGRKAKLIEQKYPSVKATTLLDEIFNSVTSCQTQCHYSNNCNGCWINFHRKYDIILLRNFERLLPKRLIEKFYGPYQ